MTEDIIRAEIAKMNARLKWPRRICAIFGHKRTQAFYLPIEHGKWFSSPYVATEWSDCSRCQAPGFRKGVESHENGPHLTYTIR